MKLSKEDARRIIVRSAGLHTKQPFGLGKQAVYDAINHIGYVQIDTISVVERAHHHVLASRIPNYRKKWLFDLQHEGKILEYWAHAAAYLPMEDFRYTLPLKEFFGASRDRWPKSDKSLMTNVLDRVTNEGPLMARDFQADGKRKGQGWWDWKPAKLALERLFFQGSLVIVGRRGFQKVYDLPENYIPGHIDTSRPSDEAYAEYLIERALRLHGIVSLPEIIYLRKKGRKIVKEVLNRKIEEKSLQKISISGLEGQVYFTSPKILDESVRMTSQVKILSPFDNVAIQRNRLKNFFDFDYQIECYVPEPKRIYGYFCLPLLYRDIFIGRIDAKADRKNNLLIIKNLHFENKTYSKVEPIKYQQAISEFALFNGCREIVFRKSNDSTLLNEIMQRSF
ncbi:MAG: YcaQ family DNA glycosylase [Saprospiraceae bacterium]|nr:YcaQ family DNA glycosylase [Saprospiraceae bacterium]